MKKFNYIVTVHNKEKLIESVLTSLLVICNSNSKIYLVLDGCTDGSEAIIDSVCNKYSGAPIYKIYMNDVHEILSINSALTAVDNTGDGYNIILQDDVILGDFNFEEMVDRLYSTYAGKLGYVSFRLGANLSYDINHEIVNLVDFVESEFGHSMSGYKHLKSGCFVVRDVAIKSPVCIPFEVVREIGLLDVNLAPHSHDDTDYCIRALERGYTNGVFSVAYYSDLTWGGTRENPHPSLTSIEVRNLKYLSKKHKNFILDKPIINSQPMLEIFPGYTSQRHKYKPQVISIIKRLCNFMNRHLNNVK